MDEPKTIERLAYGCGVLLGLALAAPALIIGTIIVDEQRRVPGFGHGLDSAFLLAALVGVVCAGACFGMAITPSSVSRRRTRGSFVLAVTACTLGLLFLVPTPLALFTWPLALVLAVVAVFLFRRAFRDSPSSS